MDVQIKPCIWYNGMAKEAANLYSSVFDEVKILSQSPFVTEISIAGQSFILLDGGPKYQPNPSLSFYYICETEAEFDRAWEGLGKEGMVMMAADKYPWAEKYGWVGDKFGVSWQIALGRLSDVGQKICPFLMFTREHYGRAEEAINHYASIFTNSSIDGILRFGKNEAPDLEGKVKHAQMSLGGYKIMIDESAAPHKFVFSEGMSLAILCDTQKEIDHYWDKLTENGTESMCGWLKDKFGVSWQVIPKALGKIMSDPAKAGKAAQTFMSMRKLDIEKIEAAAL